MCFALKGFDTLITSRRTIDQAEDTPTSSLADAIWFRSAWRRDWFAFLLVLLGLLLIFKPEILPGFELFQWLLTFNDIDISMAFLVRIFGLLIVLIYGAIIFWNRYRWCYMIGPCGIESVRGLWGREERRAEYANITSVRVYQGTIQRLFGVGNLLIRTSTTSDPQMIFAGIFAPKQRSELIQSRLQQKPKRVMIDVTKLLDIPRGTVRFQNRTP